MKTIFTSAVAAAALALTPGALFAVDQFTMQGIKSDKELQQELNGRSGFGPLERQPSSALFHGEAAYIIERLGKELTPPGVNAVQPNGSILGTDGSERMLENRTTDFSAAGDGSIAPLSSTGPAGGTESMPPGSRPLLKADPHAPFQD